MNELVLLSFCGDEKMVYGLLRRVCGDLLIDFIGDFIWYREDVLEKQSF